MSKSSTQLGKFRDLPDGELRDALTQTRDELFRLQLGQYTNQVTSTAALQTKRRDIARIMTVLRARELGTEKQGVAKQPEATETPAAEKPAKKKTTTKKAKAKS